MQHLVADLMAIPHDVTFVLDDGTEIGAARVIVGARSEPFKNMLFGAMKEGTEERVKLPGMSYDCAQGMIEWVYTGKLTELVQRLGPPPPPPPPADSFGFNFNLGLAASPTSLTAVVATPQSPEAKAMATVTDEHLVTALCEILAAAEQYAMSGLKQLCSVQLLRRATPANAASMLLCADLHGAEKLKGECLQFIAVHRHAVHANGGLHALSKELLVEAFLKTGADGISCWS